MNMWIMVVILGFIMVIVGFVQIARKYKESKDINNSTFLLGIVLPVLIAIYWGMTLTTDFSPGLTLIDLGAFIIMGMISGFFIALYLLKRKA
jgi:uncharacterized membrane protein HdeD (DUF308 family)